jgi:hypothetical protein
MLSWIRPHTHTRASASHQFCIIAILDKMSSCKHHFTFTILHHTGLTAEWTSCARCDLFVFRRRNVSFHYMYRWIFLKSIYRPSELNLHKLRMICKWCACHYMLASVLICSTFSYCSSGYTDQSFQYSYIVSSVARDIWNSLSQLGRRRRSQLLFAIL